MYLSQPAYNILNKTHGTLAVDDTPTSALSLPEGNYQLSADVDCFIKIANGMGASASVSDCVLFANNAVVFYVPNNCSISATCAAPATGTLSYHGV